MNYLIFFVIHPSSAAHYDRLRHTHVARCFHRILQQEDIILRCEYIPIISHQPICSQHEIQRIAIEILYFQYLPPRLTTIYISTRCAQTPARTLVHYSSSIRGWKRLYHHLQHYLVRVYHFGLRHLLCTRLGPTSISALVVERFSAREIRCAITSISIIVTIPY